MIGSLLVSIMLKNVTKVPSATNDGAKSISTLLSHESGQPVSRSGQEPDMDLGEVKIRIE